MATEDRTKWDARYASGSHGGRLDASVYLKDWVMQNSCASGEGVTGGMRALDVACGAGRNALYLAQAEYLVDAVDISVQGLNKARSLCKHRQLNVQWIEADLDSYEFNHGSYDLVILFRYKNIAMMPRLVAALKPGGYLLCEQHLQTRDDVVGPRSTKFRWAAGELSRLVEANELVIESSFEGLVEDPDHKPAALARLLACKKH